MRSSLEIATFAILIISFAAALPSRASADADDTLCHAIDDANGGPVDWPDDENYWTIPSVRAVWDHVFLQPWMWIGQDAVDYIWGYNLSGWSNMGFDDIGSYNPSTGYMDTPLGRTYSGYTQIVFAHSEGIDLDRDRSLDDFVYYDSALKWFAAWIKQASNNIYGKCYRDCSSGYCVFAKSFTRRTSDWVNLHQTFYYDIDAVWRASTLVHEMRHQDGYGHISDNDCLNGGSCDSTFTSLGANTYEMLWLAALGWALPLTDHPFVDEARRDRAEALFEWNRQRRFRDVPQWEFDDFSLFNAFPEYYLNYGICCEVPFTSGCEC